MSWLILIFWQDKLTLGLMLRENFDSKTNLWLTDITAKHCMAVMQSKYGLNSYKRMIHYAKIR